MSEYLSITPGVRWVGWGAGVVCCYCVGDYGGSRQGVRRPEASSGVYCILVADGVSCSCVCG